ncbi:MAG TPA: 3-hydroxybutyryl-CoA dehydrogenase [Candidatus Marinimicrobia bacterium]|nr:3-hydroxybutyryl-CoA dehydrogenase [Candidatus Neomarinimicrobiota bacterium]
MSLLVSVIGAGAMGSGIAQVAASNDSAVTIVDSSPQALENSQSKLKSILNRLVEKRKINKEESQHIISNINWSSEMNEISNSNLVIEAIVENMEIKQILFSQMESLVSDDCILATNTSSLSVAGIASVCNNPSRIMGIHFFNPAPLMKLVEVIPTNETDGDLLKEVKSILEGWGKTVVTAKDTPGFIVNRVARPFYGEALKIYEEGIADFATVDWAMKKFGGFRMGPFELMDYIGNDVNYSATKAVYDGTNHDPRYKPSATQKKLMDEGLLGRKSGKGYFDYSENAVNPEPQKNEELGRKIFKRILAMLINAAVDALNESIATRDDIDTAMKTGVNYPKGLLKWADEIGLNSQVAQLKELHSKFEDDRYIANPLLIKKVEENGTFY